MMPNSIFAPCMALMPPEVLRSTEWQDRMKGRGPIGTALLVKTPLPTFETPRKAVAVVDVARAWAGKPMKITSVTREKVRSEFTLGSRTEGNVMCYESVEAACFAPQHYELPRGKLPRGTMRMLLLLEIGTPSSGMAGIKRGPNGLLICDTVRAVSLAPLPDSAVGAKAMPLPAFWLPAGGTEDPRLTSVTGFVPAGPLTAMLDSVAAEPPVMAAAAPAVAAEVVDVPVGAAVAAEPEVAAEVTPDDEPVYVVEP